MGSPNLCSPTAFLKSLKWRDCIVTRHGRFSFLFDQHGCRFVTLKKTNTRRYLLLTTYCLLLTAYCLQLTIYLLTTYYLLLTTYYLLLTTLPLATYYLLLTTYYLLLTTYYLRLTTYDLLRIKAVAVPITSDAKFSPPGGLEN